MYHLLKTDEFDGWIDGLRDTVGKAKILTRIQRFEQGNPGDIAAVGEGISELRIHFGPGYRIYYKQVGRTTVLLLCGGDKSTQVKDIDRAKHLAAKLKG